MCFYNFTKKKFQKYISKRKINTKLYNIIKKISF